MGWPYPPGTDVDIQDWRFHAQFWAAGREKADVTGRSDEGRWPRGNVVWFRGVITAATATSITVATASWGTAPKRWVAWSAPPGTAQPSDYDCYVDDPAQLDNPKHVVRGVRITDNTATVLTVSDMSEFVTSRRITAISDLVGRMVNIIKRDGLAWSDRWPDHPNDQELAEGTVDTAAAGTLTPLTGRWTAGTLIGADVMYRDGSNVLQRGRITDDSGGVLVYTGTTGTAQPSGEWHVVVADGLYEWGRVPWAHRTFYAIAGDDYRTRLPDDTIGTHGKPKLSVTYSTGDGITCNPTTVNTKDRDVWSAVDELCSEADKCYTPDHFKCYRALQAFIEEVSIDFVDPAASFDGADAIPTFTPATLYLAASINAASAAATAWSANQLTVSFTQPWTPIHLVYTVFDPDSGDVADFGEADYSGGILPVGSAVTSSMATATVVVSRRGSRRVPCQIQRMFPKTVWIPDMDPDADPPAVIDPPAEPTLPGGAGPGDWITRPASTHLLMASDASTLGFIAESSESRDAITTGMLVRFVGDNWCDPSIFPYDSGATPDPKTPYYNRFYVGEHPHSVQGAIDAALSGVATGGSNRRLEDSSKDWYSVNATDDAGALKTHTFTASGGSTTSATFTSTSDFFNVGGGNTGGRFVAFIIEVETSTGVWEPRPIASHGYAGTTVTLTWSEAISVSASGKNCRIVEPAFELNRYVGPLPRALQIHRAATGTTHVVEITHVFKTALFFADPGFAVAAGDSYRIVDPKAGTVWLWDGSNYTKPTGTDARGVGTVDFLADQTANAEDVVTRYGFINLCDSVDEIPGPLMELYHCFNLLYKTRVANLWRNTDGSTSYTNEQQGQGGNHEEWGGINSYTWGDAVSDLGTNVSIGWPANIQGSVDSTAPYAYAQGFKSLVGHTGVSGMGMEINAYRLFSFGSCVLPSDRVACVVSWYAYAQVDTDDHDDGDGFVLADPDDSSRNIWYEYVFNTQADDVIYRKFSLFSVEGSAAATFTRYSPDALGAVSHFSTPALPAEPNPGGSFSPTTDDGVTGDVQMNSWKGYVVFRSRGDGVASWAVADWSSGMLYLD